MEIYLNEYREILDYMVSRRWEGMEYVAFPIGNGPVRKDELATFIDHYEASEYCHETATDVDLYASLPIRSVYRSMSKALNDKSLLIEKDGIVDISGMVSLHYARLAEQSVENNNQNFNKSKQKEEVMEVKNERNANYLANQMFYTGFGAIPKNKLLEKLIEGKEAFQLVHDVKYGNDSAKAILHFQESKEIPGMYFFNSFDLLLKKPNTDETLQMNFSTQKGNSFTLLEAYNLLDGRCVNKDFTRVDRDDPSIKQEYNAWAYVDFTSLDKYGNPKIEKIYDYDLEKKVDEYPILVPDHERPKMIASLKKGNIYTGIVRTNRGEETMNFEASPRFESMKFYNEKMKPVTLKAGGESQAQDQGQGVGNKQENGQTVDNKQGAKVSEVPEGGNAQGRKRSRGVA